MKYIPQQPSELFHPKKISPKGTRGLAAACMLLEEALVALGKELRV